jgi:hypothetical protein
MTKEKSMKYIWIGIVIVVLAVAGFFIFSNSSKQSVYICSDGKQVSNPQECLGGVATPQGDLEVEGQKYTAEESYTPEPQSKLEYSCKDIGKYITQEQKSFGTEGQPLTVILTKVCNAKINDANRIRVYWKIKNEGTQKISVYPHQGYTQVIANSRQYDSDFIDYDERSKDDFAIGDSTGGELKPGLIAEGGVNVEGVPLSANNLTIILQVGWYEDFTFKNIEI